MATLEELRQVRLDKIKILTENGINPFPNTSRQDYTLKQVVDDFQKLTTQKDLHLVGRVLAVRGQGAIVFVNFNDGTASFQALFKKDEMDEKSFNLFKDTIDIGDFIEVTGDLFITQRGQQTIQVKDWKMLTKSLRPLPDKWDGLQNEEEKFRKRYLDVISSEEVQELFIKKSVFWKTVRDFLEARGFMGVETPIMENMTGGAEARPFITHYNAFDVDVYLRISPELWLKRLIIAGYPKVYEVGRVFRNEGVDAEHAQDYTHCEFYQAYSDFNQGMKMVEELYKELALKTFGTLQFTIKGFAIDLSQPWVKYDYVKTIEEMTGVNVMENSTEEITNKLIELKVDFDKSQWNWNRATDTLWKWCRKKIAGPGFLVGVPIEMEPLAKKNEANPKLVERFQVLIAGSELGKGFSELNDPLDQLERFEHQAKLRDEGDDEAQMKDDEFVEALEYGMPPTFGFGFTERTFSFFAGKPIRETQIFPFMKKLE